MILKPETESTNDRAWWTVNSHGRFIVSSAYNLLRNKRARVPWYRMVWGNHLSHKIAFFLWRVLTRRVATDDILKSIGIVVVSKC